MNEPQKTSWLPLILGAVGGLQDAINTYTPLQLDDEAFKAGAEYYMQKMGNVDPLTLTVKDQDSYNKIINAVYEDAMQLVMMVTAGLMALGGILSIALKENEEEIIDQVHFVISIYVFYEAPGVYRHIIGRTV